MNKTFATRTGHFVLVLGMLTASLQTAAAAAGKPETFADPERAVTALVAAARDNDSSAMLRLFGPEARDLVNSGDPVEDAHARAHFAERYAAGHRIVRDGKNEVTLIVGTEEWPFPIPLIRKGGAWRFDTAAGADEILNRRIGRNELNAIDVCRDYVGAQRDYAADFTAPEYAQKFVSTPGKRDGLYWPASPGEKQSPIGPQMAHARAEGYGIRASDDKPEPYHGYFYKILTRQGAAAPGGARDYIVGGHMTAGYALLAFPAKYGDSGIMTFLVNQDGIVFQKDLGRDTANAASAITEFNPDLSWKTVSRPQSTFEKADASAAKK